jgi:hypothetical protein
MATPTNLAQGTLSMLDALRGLRGILGYSPISVTVRVVTSSGGAPGQGAIVSVVDTPLLVMTATNTPQNPRVIQVRERDALASGGIYSNQAMKVGPLTPAFMASIVGPAGGFPASTLNPPVAPDGSVAEVHFKLSGAGFQFPVWFKRVADEVEHATRYFVILERSGFQNPGGVP